MADEEKRLTEEEFVTQAIKKLRKDPFRGIHSVYSGFNEAFRKYFGGNPVEATSRLTKEGKIETRAFKGGVMLFLPGEVMDHPNIAMVLDAGATGAGRPFFVMELVHGFKIKDYCDQNHLSTHDRLELFIQVCQTIQHAHQKGVIHRDIKPSNILITLHDDVAVPKVIDFGISKATVGQLTDKTVFTAFDQFIGTPAYMSPEQAQMSGLDVDTRPDINSLGVLFYELLTGTTPFDAKELLAAGMDEMRRKICEDEPAKPSTCLNTMQALDLTTVAKRRHVEPPKLINLVRGDLDWLVMKCLEKDRTRRYETANGLAMDVQRHLQNETVVARPPTRLGDFLELRPPTLHDWLKGHPAMKKLCFAEQRYSAAVGALPPRRGGSLHEKKTFPEPFSR